LRRDLKAALKSYSDSLAIRERLAQSERRMRAKPEEMNSLQVEFRAVKSF
jgi:hypothetical protein